MFINVKPFEDNTKGIYFTTQTCKIVKLSIICEENDFNMYILLQDRKLLKFVNYLKKMQNDLSFIIAEFGKLCEATQKAIYFMIQDTNHHNLVKLLKKIY